MSAELEAVTQALAEIQQAVKGLHDPEVIKAAIAAEVTAQMQTPEAQRATQAAIDRDVADEPVARGKTVAELVSHVARTDEQREMQRSFDCLNIAAAVERRKAQENGRAPADFHGFDTWERFADAAKAVDTTDLSSFVPTQELSRQLLLDVRQDLPVAGLFRTITIERPGNWPVRVSPSSRGYIISEPTVDTAAKVKTRDFSGRTIAWAPKVHGARTLWSYVYGEQTTVPAAEYARDFLVRTLAEDLEDALVNGDTTATHQDGSVVDSDDPRRMVLGLRAWCVDASATYDTAEATIGTAAWEQDDVTRIREVQGKYGLDPARDVLITSIAAYYKMMVRANFPDIQTQYAYGPRAVILTGQLAAIYGMPVVVSSKVSATMDTGGLDPLSPSTYTGVLAVRTDNWMLGESRSVLLETDRDIETQQIVLVASAGHDFQSIALTSETGHKAAAYGIKITS